MHPSQTILILESRAGSWRGKQGMALYRSNLLRFYFAHRRWRKNFGFVFLCLAWRAPPFLCYPLTLHLPSTPGTHQIRAWYNLCCTNVTYPSKGPCKSSLRMHPLHHIPHTIFNHPLHVRYVSIKYPQHIYYIPTGCHRYTSVLFSWCIALYDTSFKYPFHTHHWNP